MHRLFVAIRPPPEVLDLLLDTMEGTPGLRWQSVEQLHLTLRFVGEVGRPLAEDIATALCAIAFEPFELRISGAGLFDHRNGGALWAGVEPKAPVAALAAKVERACVVAGLEPERRAFHPHVTLARWGREAGPSLEAFLARHAALRSDPFTVDRFTLFESHVGRHGSSYETIASYPLAG